MFLEVRTLLSLKFEPNPHLQWLPRYYDTNELDYVAESPHRFQQGSKPHRNLISYGTCIMGDIARNPVLCCESVIVGMQANLSNKKNMNDEKARTPRNGGADSPHLIRPAIPQSAPSRLLSCAQRIPHVPLTWPDACIITKKEKRKKRSSKRAHSRRLNLNVQVKRSKPMIKWNLFSLVTKNKKQKTFHFSFKICCYRYTMLPSIFICNLLQCPYALHSTSRCGLSSPSLFLFFSIAISHQKRCRPNLK